MTEWITLEDAEREGLDLSYVSDGIGPRRVGTVYYGAYWETVNTVTGVSVCVESGRVVGWRVSEYGGEYGGSPCVRTHFTSWAYDRGNKILHGPGNIFPKTER